jgi:hypothetical protein
MKPLKFKPHLAQLILDGKKMTTWRLFDDKNLQVGDELELKNAETLEIFSKAIITEVREKKMAQLNKNDYDGHEVFENEEDMYRHYRGYYPNHEIGPDTLVKIIHFTLR